MADRSVSGAVVAERNYELLIAQKEVEIEQDRLNIRKKQNTIMQLKIQIQSTEEEIANDEERVSVKLIELEELKTVPEPE